MEASARLLWHGSTQVYVCIKSLPMWMKVSTVYIYRDTVMRLLRVVDPHDVALRCKRKLKRRAYRTNVRVQHL